MQDIKFRPQRQPLVTLGQIDHHLADLTMTSSADLTLGQLQDKLGEHDQWLPIDGDPNLPLRTLIESNSTGPLRLGVGAWRDLLLGAQFTTRSGQFITAGGRTMKNVAGYDLTKFMVGSQGRFATLVTITTRTYKRPSAAMLAKFPVETNVGQFLTTPLRPQWAMIAGGCLWCGFLGDEKTLAFYESQIRLQPDVMDSKRQSLDDDIAFRARHWSVSSSGYRASVPPARVLEFVRDLKAFAADPVFGIVVGAFEVRSRASLRERVAGLGGTISFSDEQEPVRSETELALLRRLESAFHQ